MWWQREILNCRTRGEGAADQEVYAEIPRVKAEGLTRPRLVVSTSATLRKINGHMYFSGNTKPFQAGFVGLKIKGHTYKKSAEDAYGEYFRAIRGVNLSEADNVFDHLKDVLGDKCLHASPVVVRVKETQQDTSNVKKILSKLEECVNVRLQTDL